MHGNGELFRRSLVTVAVAMLVLPALARAQESVELQRQVVRRGAVIGLDPGLVVRVDETGTPIYLRLDLRIAACLTPWLQLGGDLRGDIISTITPGAAPKRHEIGPVAAFFLVRGLFTRIFVHVADFDPVTFIAGGQLGYEFSMDRFSAMGVALGADTDVPVNGSPFPAYSFNLSLYFSAYDLGMRRGRDPGGA